MKNIKPVIQRDLKDCGVCSMQWIIIYYDGFISLEKLREETFTDIHGTSAYHIINAFKKWGFDSYGVLVNNIKNDELKFPLVAHLILDNGLEHFVVVKKITDNTIYLMDPGIGNKKMSIADFNKLFTGNVIITYPREKIIKMEKGTTISELFIKILKVEKFLIIKIIISSLVWTLLLILSSYYLKIGNNILNNNSELVKYIIIIFGIITLLKVFVLYIREYYENHLSNLVDSYIFPEFLKHLFSLPLKCIKSRTTGEIITRVNELSSIKNLFSDIFISCFLDSIMMLISIVILYIINKKLCLILILFIVIYLILGIFVSKIMYKKILRNINYQTDFNSFLVESVNMFESIKNLNVVKIILLKIEKILSKYLYNNYEFNSFFNITNFFKDFILEICFFTINSVGFWNVYQGKLTIVDLFTFNIILSYCLDPVKNVINLLPKFNYIKATFSKITEFINIEEEKTIEKDDILKGDIIFEKVNYSYNNYDYILKNVNLIIKMGTHILLNGPSGCGKSTICKIIYKENFIDDGNVYIGNKNINDLNISSIRNNILYVSQNEELFTGSVKENIEMDRNIDEDDFYNICKICEVDKIINKKEMRYESLIEPSLNNISGGEKQRIILARALLKKANIIILDEALSEVDIKLERKIIKNIRDYFKNKTIIYISHKNQNKCFENIINLEDKNELLQN